MERFRLAVLLAALGTCAWARGQAPAAQPPQASDQQVQVPLQTLRIGTRVVDVAAVVRDKQGHTLGGLTRDDFELREDGKPEQIRYFSQGSELPLTLALLVDTSGSQKTFIPEETEASMVFFRAMLTRPEDRAALIQFDYNMLQLQPLTPDVDKLQRGLDYLSTPHPSLFKDGSQNGTLLFDAICGASQIALGPERGRRAMVLLTDGGDNGSQKTVDDAIAYALRADTTIYSIFYSAAQGFTAPIGQPAFANSGRRDWLQKLSAATGGRVFDVTTRMPLRAIYGQIAEDLRLQYQLGYRPPDGPAGSFHRIEVKVKQKGSQVEARRGYYTP